MVSHGVVFFVDFVCLVYLWRELVRYLRFLELFSCELTGKRFAHMIYSSTYITYSNAWSSEQKIATFEMLQPDKNA